MIFLIRERRIIPMKLETDAGARVTVPEAEATAVCSKPEQGVEAPFWWNKNGQKMKVAEEVPGSLYLIIAGSKAQVLVSQESPLWYVVWDITHSLQEGVKGRVVLNTDELLMAFGLCRTGHKIALSLDWEAVVSTRFIRSGNYLNIPGPGTGHDGDPNVSIFLSEKIKDAVVNLVNRS